MSDTLAWALENARQQTLALVADLNDEQMCQQTTPGEHHPAWILGHLLLGDVYLLSLMRVEELAEDFPNLLRTYGPGATPTPTSERYPSG
jgi:DinB superfamily